MVNVKSNSVTLKMEVERPSLMSDQLVNLQYFTFIFIFPSNSFMGLNTWRLILFLSFRRVLNVNYSFLGNSPASEF